MTAYYNEIDPFAAQWLRELIKQGHIAPGIVDERSIEDVTPNDLVGHTQCHFFAGIGVWSYALRQAGWPGDRPVWTGSCPCQPFSSAGKGKGFADERHLWPAFHWLIDQCRPDLVLGEQVAGKDGLTWLDLVSNDLEGSGYACGAAVTAACGFGAPHQRKRLYWVANSSRQDEWRGVEPQPDNCTKEEGAGAVPGPVRRGGYVLGGRSDAIGLADANSERHNRIDALLRQGDGRERRAGEVLEVAGSGEPCSLADASREGLSKRGEHRGEPGQAGVTGSREASQRSSLLLDERRPRPTNGHWRDADWLGCRDGKWRPVEPGTFPLAHGAAARVGRLRGYGNAIVAQQAQAWIEAVMDSMPNPPRSAAQTEGGK